MSGENDGFIEWNFDTIFTFDYHTNISYKNDTLTWKDTKNKYSTTTIHENKPILIDEGVLLKESSISISNVIPENGNVNDFWFQITGNFIDMSRAISCIMTAGRMGDTPEQQTGWMSYYKWDTTNINSAFTLDMDVNNIIKGVNTPKFNMVGDFIMISRYDNTNKLFSNEFYIDGKIIRTTMTINDTINHIGFRHIGVCTDINNSPYELLLKNFMLSNNMSITNEEITGILAHKYNMTDILPKDHPYKYIPPLKD